MSSLIIAFLSSFFCTFFIIRFEHLHRQYSLDHDLSGPQKFHLQPVPRIGGLSVILGLLVAAIVSQATGSPKASHLSILLLCATPAFAIGIAEDLTKRISIRTRLLCTAIGAFGAIYYLDTYILRLGLVGADTFLAIPLVSIIFTCFAITGLANAYNIIDGFNGLAGMVALISLAAIAYIALLTQDPLIAGLALVMIGAIGGVFIWNYPRGLIFLGDGGSYLIGFWVAVLSILLINRHQNISPWFALMVNGYPILETLFTIYRRKIHSGRSPGSPDAIHFHTLIFRRVLRKSRGIESAYQKNAKTSPYLWALSCCAVFPAVLFWNSTLNLMISALIFVTLYISLYKSVVRFKTPKWLYLF